MDGWGKSRNSVKFGFELILHLCSGLGYEASARLRESCLSVPYLIVSGDEVSKEDRDEHGEAVRDLARHLEHDDADGAFKYAVH